MRNGKKNIGKYFHNDFQTQNLSPDRKMQALGSTTILLPIVLEISL